MKYRTALLATVIVGAASFAQPDQAEARRGIPIVLNWGDEFFAERSLPVELKEDVPEATNFGYHCQHFGVLWLTLWTWDGHWCVYNDEVHFDVPDEIAAELLGIKGSDPGKPFFYRFPFGLFLSVVLLGGWTAYEVVKQKLVAKPNKKRVVSEAESESFDDVAENDTAEKQAAIEAHVSQLVSEGNADDAHRLYVNSCQNFGDWDLSEKPLLALIVALDREKRHQDALPLMIRYVERVSAAPVRLRLKLAQLLVTVDPRPHKALEVLAAIDTTSLDDRTQKIAAQLRTKADQLASDEDSELRLADD